jgi:hypothetical protein
MKTNAKKTFEGISAPCASVTAIGLPEAKEGRGILHIVY